MSNKKEWIVVTDFESPSIMSPHEYKYDDVLIRISGNFEDISKDGTDCARDIAFMLNCHEKLQKDLFLCRGIIRDIYDDMQCLEKCDSYAHEDDCPDVNPLAAFRTLREANQKLMNRIAELEQDAK